MYSQIAPLENRCRLEKNLNDLRFRVLRRREKRGPRMWLPAGEG